MKSTLFTAIRWKSVFLCGMKVTKAGRENVGVNILRDAQDVAYFDKGIVVECGKQWKNMAECAGI